MDRHTQQRTTSTYLSLDALHHRADQLVAQVRILARQILEVATTLRHSRQAQPGAKLHVGTLGDELLAHRLSPRAHQLAVPRGAHGQPTGPRGGGAWVACSTEALRPVVQEQWRHAELWNRRRLPDIAARRAMHHGYLVAERHLR